MGSYRDTAISALRSMIVRGELESGHIFSENELAAQFEFSRTPVREAVTMLVGQGLLDQIPQVGIKVHEFSEAEIQDLLETREILETNICARFADKPPTAEDIEALRALTDRMEEAAKEGDRCGFLEADASFHTEIAERALFLLAAEQLERISDKIRIVGLSALFRRDGMDDVLAEHRAIVDALEAHDSEGASRAMGDHLTQTRRRLEENRLEQRRESQ